MFAAMLKKMLKGIPFLESLRAFLEQWGIWKFLVWGSSIALAAAMSAWAWIESNVPIWVAVLVFLMALAAMSAVAYFVMGIYLKRQQQRMLKKFVNIDRDALAIELEELSKKIAALVGEFLGPMQEAWWRDAANMDTAMLRESRTKLEGQLIEKYSYRYAGDVWKLIRRASKIINLDQSDLWSISHGVRSENDLVSIYMFLAQIADDVRYLVPTLPRTDRRHEEIISRAALRAPQSQTGIAAETPP